MATKKSADGASAPKKARSSAAKAPAKKKAKKAASKAAPKKAAPKKAAAKKGGTGAIETAGPFIVERQIGGRTLTLETGRMPNFPTAPCWRATATRLCSLRPTARPPRTTWTSSP
jgi:hypothetical protein